MVQTIDFSGSWTQPFHQSPQKNPLKIREGKSKSLLHPEREATGGDAAGGKLQRWSPEGFTAGKVISRELELPR